MSSKVKKQKKSEIKQQQTELQKEKQAKVDERTKFLSSLTLLYFVAAFFVTMVVTDKGYASKSQMAWIYLPMFCIFIKWQFDRLKAPDERHHSKFGIYCSIVVLMVIVIGTILLTIAGWRGLV